MAHVRGVFGQHDVAGELTRGEPEGKVGDVVELEFCMNPAQKNNKDGTVSLCENSDNQTQHRSWTTVLFLRE